VGAVKITTKLVAVGLLGAACGVVLAYAGGMWMARSYGPHGPNDPRDAPVYVTMGLMMLAAPAGALLAMGVAIVRILRRGSQRPQTRAA